MILRRWDEDTRGDGIADALPFVSEVEELVDAMTQSGWVAEEPELHLLPHLDRACESLPFELIGTTTSDDGVFRVSLRWSGPESVGAMRAAVFELVGSFAEHASFVRQLPRDEDTETLGFEVVTGILDGDGPFKGHGHTVAITVALAS
jgi:hypothetical protein